ncbi:dynein axonemal intermediate chain 4-like isoform X2 [Diorhabda carinulata]|uniref:dynein axonemal intermediate chain 4-like isoform X2 n=1 Tax=Diorhabda carinulata TaxID=1163345 RepID=UPI0025A1929B|nr:dynein axonemal intermediate chain 4-like isoform X2 [Diorhabda carinulata]
MDNSIPQYSQRLQAKKRYLGRKPILVVTRQKTLQDLAITYEGKDVTPKPLSPEIYAGGRERQISVFDIGDRDRYSDYKASESMSIQIYKSQSTVRFKHDIERQHQHSSVQIRGSIPYETSNYYFDIFMAQDSQIEVAPTESVVSDDHKLNMPSCTAIKDTDEGNMVEEDNELYDYLTVGKGKNRKVLNAETQTVPLVMKTRNTSCLRTKTLVGTAFASAWDMYDTFQDVQSETEESDESEDSDIGHRKIDEESSIDSYKLSVDEKQMSKLIKNPRFQEAVCVTERLLANNCYNEQQKIFRGLTVPDPFRENIEFNYRLDLLWTFSNADTTGKSVNSFNWNPRNKDLLAVGYGKFFFHDNITGLVLIWNIKNPVQPERKYVFKEPITALHFSNSNPVLLAVGFYNGSVKVLNISSRDITIIGENVPTFEPVWSIIWQFGRNEKRDEELVMVTFDDGRICAYSVQRKLEMSQLMRVGKADGKLKGYDAMKKCTSLTIPVSRYSAALFVRPHPLDPSIYFVGTNEGTIHKCSLNYLSQHLDLFLAHEGSVHEMKFSPFFKQISATCGDDWHTRIWAEGMAEPILSFAGLQSVQGLDWSPTHSTILVTIRAQYIEVWDLQRKVYEPQSITRLPSNARCTTVQFTETGRCLVVGDVDGNVHVFCLEDMPFEPFFQENLLFESLSRALVTEPYLLANIKKLRRMAHDEI